MANQLNIKSEDGYRLATELSVLTGESSDIGRHWKLCANGLDREQRARDRSMRLQRLAIIAADIRASLRLPER